MLASDNAEFQTKTRHFLIMKCAAMKNAIPANVNKKRSILLIIIYKEVETTLPPVLKL